MNRIPRNTDLSFLHGLEVIQVCLGQHEIILRLHPEGAIRVEGAWLLKDGTGCVIDRKTEQSIRESSKLHKLLGRTITNCSVRDETHLDVYFGTWVLELEDDSNQYETFAIEHSAMKLYV